LAAKSKAHLIETSYLPAGFLALCMSMAVQGLATPCRAADVVRTPLLGSDFPISAAVTVPAGSDTVFVSGALASPIDKNGPKDARSNYGDTETQTFSALTNIKATLARLGLGIGDIVKMTVFLAGDPENAGRMDFLGMMKSYRKFFGTPDQPNLPSRSAIQVAGLAAPWALVEIEVIAAKTH
jgi:enamine deaminase RidA (YjgF/YER057c/UK114 family)